MDKYADRLDDAANEATSIGKAKTRPDNQENDPEENDRAVHLRKL